MTMEEAIHHLYTYSTTMGSGQTSDEQHEEAKRMAIEALEMLESAKPVSTDGDLISRQVAIEEAKRLHDVAEVVRCRDCLMTEERDKYKNKVWCFWHRKYMDDMYYCADGLRREDGEE